ncbi:unnamed protein product [marine sediment metagenome]|uniref:Uncharacterized protein n=1 Tax=marine sediment metagenome TaxID=412755 RepID=X1DJP2_9ZZZZ
MVTTAKTIDTRIIPDILFVAAGYINMGISGSHGPNTNKTNNTQGVMFFFFGWS